MKRPADEDRDGGFDQGGWVPPYVDDVVERFMSEATAGAGALLLGSGKRLFADGRSPRRLTLTATRPTPSGVLINTYRRPAEG
ncbi:hypothetical protein [Streptomyces anulatus]|uniref:hypothetical protein n=1 Tax=Streptomyces anulatus TaxID=1892 RepID=UPI00364ACB1A